MLIKNAVGFIFRNSASPNRCRVSGVRGTWTQRKSDTRRISSKVTSLAPNASISDFAWRKIQETHRKTGAAFCHRCADAAGPNDTKGLARHVDAPQLRR